MGEFVRLEVEDGVGTIRLDRPKLNAISGQVAEELTAVATEAGSRDDVGAVVIWGGPRIFAAGADVTEMVDRTPDDVWPHIVKLQTALDIVEDLPKVTIAAINGYALGGGYELALAADLRYAADNAKVGLPEIQLGIIPGAGGTQRLPLLIGVSRAKDIIFSGRQVRADEALHLGMVDRIYPVKEVYERAVQDARGFAKGPSVALAAAKRSIAEGLHTTRREGQEVERQNFVELFGTKDQKVGMRSLLEHGPGKAVFEGR